MKAILQQPRPARRARHYGHATRSPPRERPVALSRFHSRGRRKPSSFAAHARDESKPFREGVPTYPANAPCGVLRQEAHDAVVTRLNRVLPGLSDGIAHTHASTDRLRMEPAVAVYRLGKRPKPEVGVLCSLGR
jgi:hypothetical protein